MFILETKYFLWAIILFISDIIVTHYSYKFKKSSSIENRVVNFFAETVFFVFFRIICIYRNIKYISIFYETNSDQTLKVGCLLGIFSLLEFIYEIFLLFLYSYNFDIFKEIYEGMIDNASNCSLKLFLQINGFSKIETNSNAIFYISSETEEIGCWDFYEKRSKKRKIKFSPLALIIVCYIIRNEKKIENKNSKKIQQKEFDEKFYKMVISDLEKIKNDNLEKSSEYLEQVKFKQE